MNPFRMVRQMFRNAAIGGIQDAIEELNSDPGAITVKVELPALPAPPEADDKPKRNRKND